MRIETIPSLFVKQSVDVVNCLLHAPAPLPSEKEPQVHLNRRLDGPQSPSECCCGEDRVLFLLPAIEPRLPEGQPIS
jgi:hypothetical protein